MAKAVGMIGTLSGKVGNTVYASVKGETVVRVYNPNVNNPKTARQTLSRAKMAQAGILAKSMLRFVKAGFNYLAPSREFQQAVKRMVPVSASIISGTAPSELAVNYANLGSALSYDSLGTVSCGIPDFDSVGKVSFDLTWPAEMMQDNGGNAVGLGAVTCILIKDAGVAIVDFKDLTPGHVTETIEVEGIPSQYSGMPAVVYCFVKQIPNAQNGIQSVTMPWMYPAPTSGCQFVGQGDLA